MAFYRFDHSMAIQLQRLLDRCTKEGRPTLKENIAITWIRYDQTNPRPCSGLGAGWSDQKLIYPASVVKLFYAIAIEAWLQKDFLPDSLEIRQALKEMVADSNNDATSFIIDLLTGTNSGPSIHGDQWKTWQKQRQLINKWLHSLNWQELKEVNCCQKTWTNGPYGREQDFYGPGKINRNALTTAATARMLEAVMTNTLVSPPACKRLKKLLHRSLDLSIRKADPENQIDGFLGEGLTRGTNLWSKAGWMSSARHDAAWLSKSDENPMLLVVFCQGRELSKDRLILPFIAKKIQELTEELNQNSQ